MSLRGSVLPTSSSARCDASRLPRAAVQHHNRMRGKLCPSGIMLDNPMSVGSRQAGPTGPSRAVACGDAMRRMLVCASSSGTEGPVTTQDDVVRVAAVGDLVTVHFTCSSETGEVLESSHEAEEPLVFEVGAGDMMGNKLFQGFDEAVRGLAVGQKTLLEASGGDWDKELLFTVPSDHPEVERLQGRYKNHGGLNPGLVVELSNGAMAVVVDVSDEGVRIDANNMMAGKKLFFELEVASIEQAPPAAQ